MIEWAQTICLLLIVIGGYYHRKNFELMDNRLRELELKDLRRVGKFDEED